MPRGPSLVSTQASTVPSQRGMGLGALPSLALPAGL